MQPISFPSEAASVRPNGVAFAALVGNARVACMISRDALQEHFEVREIDGAGALLGMFDAKRCRIETVARGKILDGAFEPDGSVMLRSADFWI